MSFITLMYSEHSLIMNDSVWVTCVFHVLRLALWVNILVDDILKYFSYFFQKIGLDISCKYI